MEMEIPIQSFDFLSVGTVEHWGWYFIYILQNSD